MSSIEIECAKTEETEEYVKQAGKTTILITEEMFTNFTEVQESGKWNMMMDWQEAANDAKLSPLGYHTIALNYHELNSHFIEPTKYPDEILLTLFQLRNLIDDLYDWEVQRMTSSGADTVDQIYTKINELKEGIKTWATDAK